MKHNFLQTVTNKFNRIKLLGFQGLYMQPAEADLNILLNYILSRYDKKINIDLFQNYFSSVNIDELLSSQIKPLDLAANSIIKTLCGRNLSQEFRNYNEASEKSLMPVESVLLTPIFWNLVNRSLTHLIEQGEKDEVMHLTQIIGSIELTNNKEINANIFALFNRTIEAEKIMGIPIIILLSNLITNYLTPPKDKNQTNLVLTHYGLDKLISLMPGPEEYEKMDNNILSFCIFPNSSTEHSPSASREAQVRHAVVEKLLSDIGAPQLKKIYKKLTPVFLNNFCNSIFQKKVSKDVELLGMAIDSMSEKKMIESGIQEAPSSLPTSPKVKIIKV